MFSYNISNIGPPISIEIRQRTEHSLNNLLFRNGGFSFSALIFVANFLTCTFFQKKLFKISGDRG
jgi:hypothetical protein